MKNLKKLPFILSILSFLTLFTSANAEIKVVASIKPIHSLASYLMDGVGKPDLIVDGYASPHGFALKPSHAKMLQEANLIFWVGEGLENFLEKPLKSIAKNAEKIELMEIKGLTKLKFRERNIFDGHDDHGHDEDGHKEDKHDDHGHDDDGHKEDGHDDHGHDEDGHEGHAHGEYDPHIWLDPSNAKEMVLEIAHELSHLDPQNKDKYNVNAEAVNLALDEMIYDINQNINKDAKFVVFHDAYQYFEERFGVRAAGALTLNTDVLPGAKQIDEIQDLIKDKGINCIFSEPQFNPKIIETIAKDTGIKTGVFDPLGANIETSKSLYFTLINNLSENIKNC